MKSQSCNSNQSKETHFHEKKNNIKFVKAYTAELQRLEHIWNHENMF